MKGRTALFLAASLIWLAVGCSPHLTRNQEDIWADRKDSHSIVHLPDGACIDPRRLPNGWKVATSSTRDHARFGIAQRASSPLQEAPPFKLIVNIGGQGTTYRDYAEAWAKVSGKTPSPRKATSDVEGFDAFPADDGETVYISQKLDAFMECGPEIGCTIHDGIARRPIDLGIEVGWADRSDATSALMLVRRTISEIRYQCQDR